MYDTEDGWDMEREAADMEQAALEAAGREHGRRLRTMETRRAAGDGSAAARACPHSWGYPLASLAAKHQGDPRVGEAGHRCLHCGSVLSCEPWEGGAVVLVACDWLPSGAVR